MRLMRGDYAVEQRMTWTAAATEREDEWNNDFVFLHEKPFVWAWRKHMFSSSHCIACISNFVSFRAFGNSESPPFSMLFTRFSQKYPINSHRSPTKSQDFRENFDPINKLAFCAREIESLHIRADEDGMIRLFDGRRQKSMPNESKVSEKRVWGKCEKMSEVGHEREEIEILYVCSCDIVLV